MATRRAKKSKKKADAEPKAIGFLGTGRVSTKASKALLTDFVEAQDGPVKFVIPITEEFWTNSMTEVATFAEENEILIEAVWDGDEDNDPEEILEGEFEDVKTKKVADRVIKDSDVVVFLWPGKDEDDELETELLDKAEEKGLEALDLSNGLTVLEFVEVDEDEVPEEEEDDEPEDDDEDSDDGDDEEIDLATFDIDSLDTKDDRDRIMAIGEELGVESYKGMRVGTMVKEIKKAQKVLQAQAGGEDDEPEADEEAAAPAPKASKKKAEPETGDNEAEVLEAEVLSTTVGGTSISVVITLDAEDLSDDVAAKVRAFLHEIA